MAGPLLRRGAGQQRMHNVVMRGAKDQPRTRGSHRLWLEQHVQLSRGHWRREEGAGAIRSAGWRESVTVTWLSITTPERRPRCCTALATGFDTIAPPRSPNSRPQPPGARSNASTAHTRHFPHPAAPAQRRQGTSPVRPGPMTGVFSAGPACCCGAGADEEADRGAGSVRSPGRRSRRAQSPEAPRGGNAHRVTCAAAPARE